jgi:hypothetical protein
MESKKESITTPESEPSSFTERIMSAIHSSNVKVGWEEVGAVRLCQVRNRQEIINAISGGRGLFIYGNDEYYRNHSKYIPKTQ